MRDIRQDLRERLKAMEAETAALQKRLADLDQYCKRLQAVLDLEEARWAGKQPLLFEEHRDEKRGEHETLGTFLRRTMSDGQVWSLERLKEVAKRENINFRGKRPGSALHFALVALKNAGQVELEGRGLWRLMRRTGSGEPEKGGEQEEAPTSDDKDPFKQGAKVDATTLAPMAP